jgi:hypothetical protein
MLVDKRTALLRYVKRLFRYARRCAQGSSRLAQDCTATAQGCLLMAPVKTAGACIWGGHFSPMTTALILCLIFTFSFVLPQYFAIFTKPDKRLFPGQPLRCRSMILFFIGACLRQHLHIHDCLLPPPSRSIRS